jgi:hypothetical protein
MFRKISFVVLCLMLIGVGIGHAQAFSEKQLREWEKNPHWIAMMDDTTANYFETVAAFEAFWKNRELPVEEDEVLGADREDRESDSFLAGIFRSKEKEERQKRTLRHKYQYEVKRYKHWKLLAQPWIQEDGSILYPSQQMEIWRSVR